MKRFFLFLLGGIGGVMTLALLTFLAFGYLLGTHTPYCPWRHKLSDTSACIILDHEGTRMLIQHADLDSNEYYLEILDNQRSKTFKLPDSVTQLAPQGYLAELIEGEADIILLNGKHQLLEPLK
jgi:hypothetical protein